ncbi:MAG: hypothetical protein H6Q89_3972, partial [Myxococcaceae bacterium]|nr:hypothetical protein [Myxococcaceae bacterium]
MSIVTRTEPGAPHSRYFLRGYHTLSRGFV